ncbi:MAG: hypothetical protein H0W89_04300 [Candidatus Levybacteria bacterium]|nr:hypothetical protein [Candidatus Levybacteria bacterium]
MERRLQVTSSNEKQKPAEVVVEKPYVIRGHHIGFFIQLLKGTTIDIRPFSPEELSSTQSAFFRAKWEHAISNEDYEQTPEFLYWKDTIGTTTESQRRNEERQKNMFQTFVELPDDYPVELVSGRRDVICETCEVGAHCIITSSEFGEDGLTRLKRDTHVVANFYVAAKELGKLDVLTRVNRISDFTDMEPREVLAVQTTAKNFKEIIKSSDRFKVTED